MGDLLLTADELRELADLIYYQELDAAKGIVFGSIDDQNSYLEDCENTHNNVIAILKAAEDADTKYKTDETKTSIAHQIFEYVLYTVSCSFQKIVNYSVRAKHVQKLFEHTNSLLDTLENLNTQDAAQVERFSSEVTDYKEAMTKYLEKYKKNLSNDFSRWLANTNMSFEELVASYTSKLGYEGAFTDLEEAEKVAVYDEVLKDAGVGNIFKMKTKEVIGLELMILSAGIMVWDIFTADKKLETASRDAGEVISNITGAILGDVVETFVEGALAESCEVAGYVAFGVGLIASFAGTFIIGAAVAALLGIIFSSGGSKKPKTEEIRCYGLRIPDPVAQAREIRYDRKKE